EDGDYHCRVGNGHWWVREKDLILISKIIMTNIKNAKW
ncbi:unnamed protein product, partial [marine sediment metagenome]